MGIAVFIKSILYTVNFFYGKAPRAKVIIRTDIVSVIAIYVKPLTCSDFARRSKMIKSTADHTVTGICLIVISKAIPSFTNLNPTVVYERTVDYIITIVVQNNKTCSFVLVTTMTSQSFTNNSVIMTGSLLNCTPIQDRVASLANSTSGITSLCARSRLVRYSYLSMIVPFYYSLLKVSYRRVKFRSSVHTNVGETGHVHIIFFCVFHITILDLVTYGNLRSAVLAVPLSFSIVASQFLVPAPCIHRNSK